MILLLNEKEIKDVYGGSQHLSFTTGFNTAGSVHELSEDTILRNAVPDDIANPFREKGKVKKPPCSVDI